MPQDGQTSLEQGADMIRRLAKSLPDSPGVYRMLNEKADVLYVGKAKSLRKRVASYANMGGLSLRIKRMVAETVDMVFVQTHTETEALLLESNLIKKLKPRYNVLLRDDKSFPYICITDHDFPLVTKHRGAKSKTGEYFGPFASAGAVNRTLNILQKAFMLRNCSDNVFANRQRPCLQYHIKRCTAPCVSSVDEHEYETQVAEARAFLSGKSRDVQQRFVKLMEQASDRQDYELAARYRDRIKALTTIQGQQDIHMDGVGNADVFSLYKDGAKSCVQVFFYRAGQNFGNRAYYPRHSEDDEDTKIMGAFLAQFYENKPVPDDVLVSVLPEDKELLEQALTEKRDAQKAVRITRPARGAKKRLIDAVYKNAREALDRESLRLAGTEALLAELARIFEMAEPPRRIEVYDNSHISGTDMVGGMIVAGPEGFIKNAYRKFNIKTAERSDDYGMMKEVISRRCKRLLTDNKTPEDDDWPHLMLIDGGKGQLSVVKDVLSELDLMDHITLVSIAKGKDRHAGRETFFMAGKPSFQLPVHDPVLHYLQRLRDEAHRFAIGTHRAKRTKKIESSPLDQIAGIGPARKKALLHYFGSSKEVEGAAISDLEKVEGVSKAMAKTIYDFFHPENS